MSLINQMLKDLDKRKGKHADSDATAGLEASSKRSGIRSKTLPYTIIVLVVVIAVAVYLLWFSPFYQNTPINLSADKTRIKSIIANAKKIKPKTPVFKVSSIEYGHQNGNMLLTLNFTQKPHVAMSLSTNHKTLTLNLGKATLPNALPKPTKTDYIQSINQGANAHTLKLALTPGTLVKSLNHTISKPYKVTLALGFNESAAPKPKAAPAPKAITKKAVPETPEQRLNKQFNQILSNLTGKNAKAAVIKLRSFVNDNPDYVHAIDALATYYATQKYYTKALNVLNSGLANTNNNIHLVVLKARILTAQHKLKNALSLLSQYSPNIKQSPEFYELTAAVEQQLGNSEMAAQYYQELIDFKASNGKYWLGYGLSLEQLGRNNAAMRAFKQALNSENMNPSLKAFLRTKIEQLGA